MRFNSIKQIVLVFFAAICAFAFCGSLYSCKPDPDPDVIIPEEPDGPVKPGKGVFSITPAEPQIGLGGGVISIAFVTLDDWTVSTESTWFTITSAAEGGTGDNNITVSCQPYQVDRSADIKIKVKGYAEIVLCTVTQAPMQAEGGTSVVHWISNIMSQKYLWNSAYNNIKNTLNFNTTYDKFLNSALAAVRVNEEDGYVADGTRYYYTNISRYSATAAAPSRVSTRAQSLQNNYGISFMLAGPISGTANYAFVVGSVYPDSPADKAGLTRGCYITKCNGASLTENNLVDMFYTLLGYQPYYTGATMNLSIRTPNLETDKYDTSDITVTPAEYDANPILYADVYTVNDTQHNIGYLSLATFDLFHDEELIELFKEFKSQGVNDMILDLRYNPGGYVYSSTVLATAIAGASKKGEVYSHMQYNADRTATGEAGYFYIGEDPSMQTYPLIGQALEGALDLKRVYVITTDNTASASELVINGLRGLDIEVLTVGTSTQGKNTGMEVQTSNAPDFENYNFGNYVYVFEPISFYNLNAKGFSDYHGGFAPTFEINEADYTVFDWKDFANNDVLLMSSVVHIITGSWPQLNTIAARRSPGIGGRLFVPDGFRAEGKAKVFATESDAATLGCPME